MSLKLTARAKSTKGAEQGAYIDLYKRPGAERRKWSKMAESDENSIDSENDNEDLYKGYEHDYDRIERLFNDLDRNRDGKIDADELAAGLKRLRVRHSKGQLKVGFLKCLIIYLSPI